MDPVDVRLVDAGHARLDDDGASPVDQVHPGLLPHLRHHCRTGTGWVRRALPRHGDGTHSKCTVAGQWQPEIKTEYL